VANLLAKFAAVRAQVLKMSKMMQLSSPEGACPRPGCRCGGAGGRLGVWTLQQRLLAGVRAARAIHGTGRRGGSGAGACAQK